MTELEAKLEELKRLQAMQGAPPQPAPVMQFQPQPPAPPAPPMQFQPPPPPANLAGQPMGLLVPCSLPTPAGEVTVYLQFGAAEAANVPAVIEHLLRAGYPVKAWQKKQFGGGGGGYNGGGGFGGGQRRPW